MQKPSQNQPSSSSLEQGIAQISNLRKPLVIISIAIFLTVGLVIFASTFVKIAGAIVGAGELRVLTQKTLIQHEDGGRISSLLIKNGQQVEVGQILLRLESAPTRLARNKLLTQIDSQKRQSQRLRSVLQEDLRQTSDEASYQLSTADLVGREGSSIRAVVSRIITFNQADKADIRSLEVVQKLQDEQISLRQIQVEELNETLAQTAQLVSKGLETELQFKEQRNALRAQQIALVDLRKSAAQSQREITSLKAQISKRIFEFQQNSLESLIKAEDELSRLEAELNQIDEQLNTLELRAGLSGRIANLTELNVGTVLRAGDVVAEIIPIEQEVIAEVFVSANEIDLFEPGDFAQIEIATLKRASQSRLKARVETIAADLKIFDDGRSAFPVQVKLLDPRALPVELARNGVPVTSYIPVADRSLGAYLITPIVRWSRQTFKEF